MPGNTKLAGKTLCRVLAARCDSHQLNIVGMTQTGSKSPAILPVPRIPRRIFSVIADYLLCPAGDRKSAIDDQGMAGNEGRLFAGKEINCIGNLNRFRDAAQQSVAFGQRMNLFDRSHPFWPCC